MLKVTLLGTGGTQPLPDRALAAAAVTVPLWQPTRALQF